MTRIATFFACDQVAQAGLGKLAFVGAYGGDIMVPKLPLTLEQLFFVVRFRTPIGDPPKKLVVRIERPGDEPYIVDQTAALAATANPAPPDATFLDVQALVRIAPFVIRDNGAVRVFVVDENEEHYAGGIRVTIGIHPEMRLPQIAQTVALAGGHYKRLNDEPKQIRYETASQLIEVISAFVNNSGFPAVLQFPKADVRLSMDEQRMHVFFPKSRETDSYEIAIEPGPEFELVSNLKKRTVSAS